MLHELSGIEIGEADIARPQPIAHQLKRTHAATPHRPVVGRGQRYGLAVTIGLIPLRLYADQVRGGLHHRIEPGMPATRPGKARAVFDIDHRRRSGVGKARKEGEQFWPLHEPAERVDRQRRGAFRASELAALDFLAAGSPQPADTVIGGNARQKLQLSGHLPKLYRRSSPRKPERRATA